MRVNRSWVAGVLAISILGGCSGSSAIVDSANAKSLYIFNDKGVYEYAPGGEHVRRAFGIVALFDPAIDRPAIDARGNLYVQAGSRGLKRYNVDGSADLLYPSDMDGFALDAAGNAYLAAGDGSALYAPAGAKRAAKVLAAIGAGFQGIAVAANGRAYVASMPDGHIRVFDDGLHKFVTTIAAPTGLASMALDNKGRLYAISASKDTLYEYASATASPETIDLGGNAARVSFDRDGNAYVLEEATYDAQGVNDPGDVLEFAFGQSQPLRTIAEREPRAIAFDDRTDVFISSGVGVYNPLVGLNPSINVYGPTGDKPIRQFNGDAFALIFGPVR